jgi:hypothetical protein
MRFSGPVAPWIPPPTPEVDPHVAALTALTPRGIVFRNDLLPRLNTHAVDLAVQHGVTVRRATNTHGRADPEGRTITCPAVTDDATYAVFLHELAHVVDPDADSRQFPHHVSDTSLIAVGGELGAWAWAVKHALVWTKPMQEKMHASLLSYRQHATPADVTAMAALLVRASMTIVASP